LLFLALPPFLLPKDVLFGLVNFAIGYFLKYKSASACLLLCNPFI
jgi:hypothetical protein